VVVNIRNSRGGKQSEGAWWYTIGFGVVVYNRIGRGGKHSDFAWY
jgi:hypothetical protein